jgi:dihydrofolate synthase / folylpolyglutamate synthase
MITSYQEALTFLYDNLPMFQRVGAAAVQKDLHNTLKLCKILGDPQDSFPTIHVAGTNGKGSTCHMLASVMQESGYKTGLYTSPHLKEFTERIRVNGKELSKEFVVRFVNRIRSAIEEIRPSFFEITVAMAFDYFRDEKVDLAVIEVGLGGRLDSTNVITPLMSVITNISFDHKDLLGETLPEIAREKAGIIKRNVPVVVSQRQPETDDVFIAEAQTQNAEIYFASEEYSATMHSPGTLDIFQAGRKIYEDIPFPLLGEYQRHNVPGVMKALEVLSLSFPVIPPQIRNGLMHVVINTGLKGRWQILHTSPTVVCDTAHNEGGIREVVRQISHQRFERLFMIIGMVKDKDVGNILKLLPKEAFYYFCQATIPRAMDAARLEQMAADAGLYGEVVPDVNEASAKAIARAGSSDFIFIGGSTYVVAELDEL